MDLSTPELPPQTRRELRERERGAAGSTSNSASTATSTSPKSARAARIVKRRAARSGSSRSRALANDRARAERRGPRSRATGPRKSFGSHLLSVGAMLFAVALTIGVSIPAALYSSGEASATADQQVEISAKSQLTAAGQTQSLDVPMDALPSSVARDGFTAVSWAEILKDRYGSRDFSYSAVASGAIRWPFPAAVEISSGFGDRAAPCRGCSSFHEGLDFVPGDGTPIFAIADGVVTTAEDGGAFGNHVVITHIIDGEQVTSLYAHMQHGSVALTVGQQIRVGDFIGLVGRTGAATGPHLHFEVMLDGVHVDPFAWLKAKAG